MDELLAWQEPKSKILVSTIPLNNEMLATRQKVMKSRIFICHDMKGGYGDDKFINGFDGLKIPDYIWPNVDAFIYFSHNFITIPSESSNPEKTFQIDAAVASAHIILHYLLLATSWTETAHSNSSMSLGTIITEWDEGKIRCSKLLENIDAATDQLALIQNYFGFDGWLVNIENTLEAHEINLMIEFVKKLRQKCETVIWYVLDAQL